MEKNEILSQLDALAVEKRSFMASVENGSGAFDEVAANEKIAQFEARKAELNKKLAECKKPLEAPKQGNWRAIADGMMEKRSVTLSGTGVVSTVKELAKKIVNKTDILNGARFFYGPNASTKIPVWGTQLTAAFLADGGTGSAAQNTLSVTSIDPAQALCSLPVSQMALDLSAAELESELPDLFAGAFSDLLADGMINGKSVSNTVVMTGLFAANNDTTAYAKSATLTNLAELCRTVKAKSYANPVVVMSPTVYALFLADTSTNETTKIYKESLIRDKMLEDVKIVLTAYAPSTGSGGSGAWADNDVIAVAGDLSNYAIGMAGQINIKPKDTASTTVVTFDATIYAAGKPVIAADFYQYKIDV